jgi:hypothetical protein
MDCCQAVDRLSMRTQMSCSVLARLYFAAVLAARASVGVVASRIAPAI